MQKFKNLDLGFGVDVLRPPQKTRKDILYELLVLKYHALFVSYGEPVVELGLDCLWKEEVGLGSLFLELQSLGLLVADEHFGLEEVTFWLVVVDENTDVSVDVDLRNWGLGDLGSLVPKKTADLRDDVHEFLNCLLDLLNSFLIEVLDLIQRLFVVSFRQGKMGIADFNLLLVAIEGIIDFFLLLVGELM